jgi:hypothetical protein
VEGEGEREVEGERKGGIGVEGEGEREGREGRGGKGSGKERGREDNWREAGEREGGRRTSYVIITNTSIAHLLTILYKFSCQD